MEAFEIFVVILGLLTLKTLAQENTQTRVAPALIECYAKPEIFERDNRLPMTINMLIELIRKVEDDPTYRQDIRQLTVSLVHRFRQDGIIKAPGAAVNSNLVLPFSPASFHFTKHRTLFSKLIPGNAITFPNDTLSVQERCALHFMLSSSIEMQVRGDESTRCNQLSQYRAHRVPRHIDLKDKTKIRSNYVGDVEILSQPEMKGMRKELKKKFGRLALKEVGGVEGLDDDDQPEETPDEDDIETNAADVSLVDIATNAQSQCPVENGVIRTTWGAISAGTVLTGIAAGLEQQTVLIRDLLPPSRTGEYRAKQSSPTLKVDNRWASTLSGDLGEVTLLQGPIDQENINVGAPGAWNSTVVPKWYFLSQRTKLEMTDAEIRGGIDGLILANGIVEWRNKASGLKLSQVLDMYYSHRGIFGSDTRSCNRRGLFTQNVPIETLREQTTSFSHVLEKEMQMVYTLSTEAIKKFSESSAEALSTYIPQSLNDLSCEATSRTPNDDTIFRAASELYIFVDASWPFREIQPVVTYLLDGLDVGRLGTRYTVLNAQDGRVIVNTTMQLSDLATLWNTTMYQQHPPGLNLPKVMQTLRTLTKSQMDYEQLKMELGGRSQVALIIPQMATVSEGETNSVEEQRMIFREIIPDLRFIYMAGGSPTRFDRFVEDKRRDIFPLRSIGSAAQSESVQTQVTPVINRIQEEPRRIINYRCGSNWDNWDRGSNTLNQYVDPKGVVFYRLHPNYFFLKTDGRKVKVQAHGYSTITICHSRWVEFPRANTTNDDGITCKRTLSETVEIDLSNACDGYKVIHKCPPLYISIEGAPNPDAINMRCTDNDCRFPDNARFGIVTENLGCYSSAGRLLSSIFVVLSSFVVFYLR